MLDLCLINNADLYMYILPPEFFIRERKKKFNDINKCELVFFHTFETVTTSPAPYRFPKSRRLTGSLT